MKKLIIGILIIAIAVIAYITIHQSRTRTTDTNTNDSKAVVKIGVILPLSGDQANLGQTSKGAIEVAAAKISKMDTKYNYKFIFEDNRFEAAKTAPALQKLISIDKIDALIDGGSAVAGITSPVAEEKKILHLNIWSSDARIAKGRFNFLNWTQPHSENEKMVETILSRGYQNVHIIAHNHNGTLAVGEPLEKELAQNNIKATLHKINMETRDMRLDIRKIEKSKPDLYLLILFSPGLDIFIKQMKELGVKTEITGIEVFSFLEDLSIVEGAWYVDVAQSDSTVMEEIRQHNQTNFSYGMGNAYDSAMMLVYAYENAPTKEQAVDALSQLKEYDGIVATLRQDEEGVFQSDAVLKKVINGKAVIVKDL